VKLRRAFSGFLVLGFALHLGAAENALPVASANFSGGVAQLRVVAVSQVPQGRRDVNLKLELQLEIPPAARAELAGDLPETLFLDNETTPLVALSVTAGRNLAKTAHAWAVEGKTGRLTIADLDLGDVRQKLLGVELELVLTKVAQWETLAFQAGLGRSDFFQCGPFELRASGEARQFRVDVWAYPQFKAQHDAFRQRMPVTFLNPVYGMQQLKVVDSANRSPTSVGSSVPSVGAATSTYSGFRPPEGDAAAANAAATSEDISYPVSMILKLPKRIEKERVKFRFDVIPLAPPPPPAKGR
jgi:hypothetical protein